MHYEKGLDLEQELEEARVACEEAEQRGAELAEHALQSEEELKELHELLWHLRETMKRDAKRTLELERWIALFAGIFIYLGACNLERAGLFAHDSALKLPAYLMCLTPGLYLFLRNGWRRFQIMHDWNSWSDNEFANDIREIWDEKRPGHEVKYGR